MQSTLLQPGDNSFQAGTYVLHKNLGEDVILNPESAKPIKLRLVASLDDSLFQGELLVSEASFLRAFPDEQGYRFFLMDVAPERIHVEIFNGSESMTPGVVGAATRAPHLPKDDANTGPLVSFARSGIAVHWKASAYQSILELAEACDVPVRWSCRTGVCHNCESGLVSGAVAYGPQPLEKPADGNLLICCSHPIRDVVIDL